jgi:DNA-binding FadR family transcriptional regulator
MRIHANDAKERDAADRAFHVAIAESVGNTALTLTVEDLWDQRSGDLWAKIEQHFHSPALRKKTLADHEAILAALEARDADAARTAMRRHLARVAEEFQRRIDQRPEAAAARAPTKSGRAKSRVASDPGAARQRAEPGSEPPINPAGTPRRGG